MKDRKVRMQLCCTGVFTHLPVWRAVPCPAHTARRALGEGSGMLYHEESADFEGVMLPKQERDDLRKRTRQDRLDKMRFNTFKAHERQEQQKHAAAIATQ